MPTVPLLSISIPTYNRARSLGRLLAILQEQTANDPCVEVIVSDNASTDDTQAVVEGFLQRGMVLRYVRNRNNVGGDENIRRCYAMAQGKFVWVFGDDDVIAPGALYKILTLLKTAQPDLVFMAPYHCPGEGPDYLPKWRMGRGAILATSDPVRLVNLVDTHSDFMFITSVIVNQEFAGDVVQPDLSGYVVDNIVQLAWILPVLRKLRMGVFVDAQWIGQAVFNAAGGFDASDWYGLRFCNAVNAWLDPESSLARRFTSNHLTMWAFNWLQWKWHNVSRDKIEVSNPHRKLRSVYGENWRYWLCVYPLIALPKVPGMFWALPLLVRRKLLRWLYQAITPSLRAGR